MNKHKPHFSVLSVFVFQNLKATMREQWRFGRSCHTQTHICSLCCL